MRSKFTTPARKIRNQKIKSLKRKEEAEPLPSSTGKKLRLRDLEDYNNLGDDDEKSDYWDSADNFTD